MHGIDNIVKKKKRTLNPDGNFKSKPFYQTSYEKKKENRIKRKMKLHLWFHRDEIKASPRRATPWKTSDLKKNS